MTNWEILNQSLKGGQTVGIETKRGEFDCIVERIWWDDMNDNVQLKKVDTGATWVIAIKDIIEVKRRGLAWAR